MSPLSRIFVTTCLDPFRIPQQSLAQVPVRTPSEAQETFRGRAGNAAGVAQTVRPQPGDATADSQSAYFSHSPHHDVRGKRSPARRPAAGCLLCNPLVASAAARTARSAADASELGAAEACPPHSGGQGACQPLPVGKSGIRVYNVGRVDFPYEIVHNFRGIVKAR